MKYLIMGPIPPPYHGQSVALSSVVNKLKEDNKNQCTIINISGINTKIKGLLLCFKIIYLSIFFKYDAIYYTCSRSTMGAIRDIVLLYCCKLRKQYVVNHLHGSDFKSFYDKQTNFYKKIIRNAYKNVNTTIVLLEEMKKEFQDFPNMNIQTVANSYSSSLDSLPLKKKENNKILNIIYLSNIMKTKGILNLLEAIKVIFTENQDINLKLYIAGQFIKDEEASQNNIEVEFFRKYNALKDKYNDKIEYIGIITGNLKKKKLWDSDIFILPTYYKTEAFPISILEAMRAGNYIISTNYKYIPSVISSKNGELIEPKSIEAIIKAIKNVVSNKDKVRRIQNYNISQSSSIYNENKYLSTVIGILKNKK